jgi:UV DNA damage endonuclease
MLRLGLCCAFVNNDAIHFRTTTVRYASTLPTRAKRTAYLHDLSEQNLCTLAEAIRWCASHGIFAFRVMSGLLPLYTHPALGWRLTAGKRGAALSDQLAAVGAEAHALGVRLSFHPDQFVVLGSATESIVRASIAELEYQAECAELLRADQLTLHGGGAVGGKDLALSRFRRGLDRLSPRARALLALENDDRVYTVADLLPLCRQAGVPLVYDVHHHRCNRDALSVEEATLAACETWCGREPWMHISSPATGWSAVDARPHADYIRPTDVPREWLAMTATVDVEAKQKERAVLRLQRWLNVRVAGSETPTPRVQLGVGARR